MPVGIGQRSRGLLRAAIALAVVACALAATTGTASALRVLEPDGSVIVAWGDVNVTRIAPDGIPDGDVHDISPEPHIPSDRLHPEESHLEAIGAAPDGVVTVVWLNIEESQARIVSRRLAADGTPLGEPVVLASGEEEHTRVALGVGPDGTATVVWNRLASPGTELVARRIAPDGTPEEGVQVLSGPEPLAYWPDLAMAPDGTATVVWSERAGADTRALVERRIEPDGTLEPTTNTLDSTAAYDPHGYLGEPEVEGAADGSAVALWEHVGADDELWARRIEPDGSLQDARLLDSFTSSTNYRFPRLAVAPDGSATVSWRSEGNVKVLDLDSDGVPGIVHPITNEGAPLPAEPYFLAAPPLLEISPDGDRYVFWGADCEGDWCLYFGILAGDGSLGDVQQVDRAKTLSWWEPALAADGSGTLIWGHLYSHEPIRSELRARKLEADGTLGPIGEVFNGDSSPVLTAHGRKLEFGEVEVGSEASRPAQVSVLTDEAIGPSSASVEGADAGRFAVEGSTCGPQLAYPATCSVTVSFSPIALGSAEAELVLEAGENKEPAVIPLAGEGTPPLPGPPPPPAPPQPPAPEVHLGKALLDPTGKATLPVVVPGPGFVKLYGPCIGGADEARSAQVTGAGTVELEIIAKGHCRRQLLRRGWTRFGVRVVFTGADGQVAIEHRPVRLKLAG